MITNGITVPDQGTTTEYIVDSVGGWVYQVTTNITVAQLSVQRFKDNIAIADAELVKAQAKVAELAAQKDVVDAIPISADIKP